MRLNRPTKRNALTVEMWGLVAEAVGQLDSNPSVRVVVLSGVDDSAFSAGADVSEFRSRRTVPADVDLYNRRVQEAERRLAECTKPTVAVIRGPCIGGGCELALACDFRFCDTTARFAIPVAKLGLVYGLAATRRLVDVVGPGTAKWLLFTGEQISAEEAMRIGLVSTVTPSQTLAHEVDRFVNLLCSRSRASQAAAKRMMTLDAHDPSAAAEAAGLVRGAYEGGDYREGVAAFLEKRPPHFL